MENRRILVSVISVFLIAAVLLGLPFIFSTPARAEVIFQEENPDFKFKIYDTGVKGANWGTWKTQGELVPFDGDKYTINTNAYCMWWEADDIAYAYNNYVADYGDKGKITVEVTVLNRDLYKGSSLHSNASTGIAIRDNDSADSPSIYLHCRGNWIGVVYRTKAGTLTILSTDDGAPPKYPVKLKVEKAGNAVKSYYMNNGETNWISLGTVYAKMDKTVMPSANPAGTPLSVLMTVLQISGQSTLTAIWLRFTAALLIWPRSWDWMLHSGSKRKQS